MHTVQVYSLTVSFTHRVDIHCLSYSRPVVYLRLSVRVITVSDPSQSTGYKETFARPLRGEWLKTQLFAD